METSKLAKVLLVTWAISDSFHRNEEQEDRFRECFEGKLYIVC